MRILHLGTYDAVGGAARAQLRLHRALRESGVSSRMLVRTKRGTDLHVDAPQIGRSITERWIRWRRRRGMTRQAEEIARIRPPDQDGFHGDRGLWGGEIASSMAASDVVHLHWTQEFLDLPAVLPSLTQRQPVVWTLHDLHGLTGGCHYPRGCEGWRTGCLRCPQLTGDPESTLAARVWSRVHRSIRQVPSGRLHVVTASRWMAELARKSPHFEGRPVSCIPLGLNTDDFAPRDRRVSRQVLGLPEEARIVLFVSDATNNPRKGLQVLADALQFIPRRRDLMFVSLGQGTALTLPAGIAYKHLDSSTDDRWLSLVYSAADLFVIPSLEEAYGQTMLESLACGTPVVGSETGGIPDLVIPDVTGALFAPGNARALAEKLAMLLNNPEAARTMGRNGRARVESSNSFPAYAQSHLEVYRSLFP